jgi:hypothetical protein
MEPTPSWNTCDRSGCPAPGIDELILHGQDFHFCHHHATEIAREEEQPRDAQHEDELVAAY